MGVLKRTTVAGALVLAALVPTMTTAGAVGYDNSNPSSTGCVNKGQVAVAGSAKSYLGVWTIELRRSTGCNTVWARIIRTDGKRCRAGGQYCARIQVQRVKSDGTKTQTTWRTQPGGTARAASLQLDVVAGATYTGRSSTVGGATIGNTAAIRL